MSDTDDEVFVQILYHAISQFQIDAMEDISQEVLFSKSPDFIQEIMINYMDRGEPSAVITGGGSVLSRMQVSVLKTLIHAMFLVFMIMSIKGLTSIDHYKCYDKKPNFLGLFYIKWLDKSGLFQNLYCQELQQAENLLSDVVAMIVTPGYVGSYLMGRTTAYEAGNQVLSGAFAYASSVSPSGALAIGARTFVTGLAFEVGRHVYPRYINMTEIVFAHIFGSSSETSAHPIIDKINYVHQMVEASGGLLDTSEGMLSPEIIHQAIERLAPEITSNDVVTTIKPTVDEPPRHRVSTRSRARSLRPIGSSG